MWKDLLENEKIWATFFITIICCWAMAVMGATAKDIIIPAITGIAGFVTGRQTKSETVQQVEEANKVDLAKITAGKEVEAAKTGDDAKVTATGVIDAAKVTK